MKTETEKLKDIVSDGESMVTLAKAALAKPEQFNVADAVELNRLGRVISCSALSVEYIKTGHLPPKVG